MRTNQILGEILGRRRRCSATRSASRPRRPTRCSAGKALERDPVALGRRTCRATSSARAPPLQRYLAAEAVDQAAILLHDAGDTLTARPSSGTTCRGPSTPSGRGFDFGVVEPADRPRRSTRGRGCASSPRRGRVTGRMVSRAGAVLARVRSTSLDRSCRSAAVALPDLAGAGATLAWRPGTGGLGRPGVAQRHPGPALPDRP